MDHTDTTAAVTNRGTCETTLERAGIVDVSLYPSRLLEVLATQAADAGREGDELCADLAVCLEAELRRRGQRGEQ